MCDDIIKKNSAIKNLKSQKDKTSKGQNTERIRPTSAPQQKVRTETHVDPVPERPQISAPIAKKKFTKKNKTAEEPKKKITIPKKNKKLGQNKKTKGTSDGTTDELDSKRKTISTLKPKKSSDKKKTTPKKTKTKKGKKSGPKKIMEKQKKQRLLRKKILEKKHVLQDNEGLNKKLNPLLIS